ncbi:MAG: PAS domain S-box protein [Bacteroidales bacterium]|nr:PAS domain S-box protein [Bacteroidales bacterium]
MKKPKNEAINSDYGKKSREELIQELEKTYLEYNSLKTAFQQINTNFQYSKDELSKTAEKLKECENEFCNIFDNMFNGLLVVDIFTNEKGEPYDHKFVRANKISEKLTGKKVVDVIGKSSRDLNLEWPPELLYQLYQVTKQGTPIEYERYNEFVGKYFHTQVFSPAPKQLAFVFDDITERKEAENQLIAAKEKAEENELRFRAISDQVLDGIALADMQGNYVFVNPSFCEMTGYSETELLEKNVFELAVMKDEPSMFQYIKQHKDGQTVRRRRKLIRRDKSLINVDINGRLITINNEEFIMGVVRDVTEQMRVEKELIAAKERAEESDRLKTAFLMNMSHEIRTPMNAILGFLDLLKEPDLDDSQKLEYINIVNKSGERLLDTINDIIEISRIEAGETRVSEDIVNIEETLQFYYDLFKYDAELKGLAFRVSQQVKGSSSIIKTDKQKLENILSNLIKNAIKFTSKGSVEIGNYLEDDTLVFYVKDTGKGIPADRFDVIFDRFVQADMSLTRAHEGSGLGLAIVKAHVQLLGGKIWLQSKVGEGSTFYFSLPLSRESQESVGENYQPYPDQQDNTTILIVEDDELSFQYYEIILSPYSKLIHERNGVDAVKTFEERKGDISLILMDMKMPGKLDGFEATRTIREKDKDIPIIAQTAYAMEIDKMKALEAGCNDYVTKPVSKEKLLSLIAKYSKSKS